MALDREGPGAGGAGSGLLISGSNNSENTPRRRTPQERWQDRNPLKRWAHGATRSAVHYGVLAKPSVCSCCGKTGRIEAHHPDHANPLRVVWLLASCHRRLHATARRAAR